jgi:tRNA(Ile)-lysidine synthase
VADTRRLNQLVETTAIELPPGPRVVALSGGADSACLAYLVSRAGGGRALHVDHGQPASPRLREAAVAVAAATGLELAVLSIAVAPFSEGSARRERYRVLLAALEPGEWLLTAHTADDQAETVLANLLRGSGVEGLVGIPARRAPVARPLLAVPRAVTREIAALAGLDWYDDPTNEDTTFLRNRIRRQLLPALEAAYNPQLRRRLVDTAAITAGLLATIDLVPGRPRGNGVVVAWGMLQAVGEARAGRSLRELMRPLLGGYGPTRAEVERAWEVVTGTRRAAEVQGGWRISRSGPWLEISRPGGEVIPSEPVTWRVPGWARFGPWRLEGHVLDGRPAALPLSPWRAVLDVDKTGTELVVKAGEGGRPVVTGAGGPVWRCGERTLEAGWVEPSTRRYLSVFCAEEL